MEMEMEIAAITQRINQKSKKFEVFLEGNLVCAKKTQAAAQKVVDLLTAGENFRLKLFMAATELQQYHVAKYAAALFLQSRDCETFILPSDYADKFNYLLDGAVKLMRCVPKEFHCLENVREAVDLLNKIKD
jgi:hypothetical protein